MLAPCSEPRIWIVPARTAPESADFSQLSCYARLRAGMGESCQRGRLELPHSWIVSEARELFDEIPHVAPRPGRSQVGHRGHDLTRWRGVGYTWTVTAGADNCRSSVSPEATAPSEARHERARPSVARPFADGRAYGSKDASGNGWALTVKYRVPTSGPSFVRRGATRCRSGPSTRSRKWSPAAETSWPDSSRAKVPRTLPTPTESVRPCPKRPEDPQRPPLPRRQ